MLKHTTRLIRHKIHKVTSARKRSSQWDEVRDKFIESNPVCASCGSNKRLNVHHIKPFHLHPDLELEPENLITLCMTLDCHLIIGHGDNFKAYNPDVKTDAEIVKSSDDKKAKLKEIEAHVKAKRLYE